MGIRHRAGWREKRDFTTERYVKERMSSSRLLVFTPRLPDLEWIAASRQLTFIVRRTDHGYRAFLQTWSNASHSYIHEDIPYGSPDVYFATQIEAETACQMRYEQALRWRHMGNP
jgi:type IV pilus biogenesis protein CpaD/CtpE